jgi:hypothetical protein
MPVGNEYVNACEASKEKDRLREDQGPLSWLLPGGREVSLTALLPCCRY